MISFLGFVEATYSPAARDAKKDRLAKIKAAALKAKQPKAKPKAKRGRGRPKGSIWEGFF